MEQIKQVQFVVVSIFSLLCFGAGMFYLFQEYVDLATVIICFAFGFVSFLAAAVIYGNRDPWAREKDRLDKLMLEVFGYEDIPWNDLIFPEYSSKFPRLEIVLPLSAKELIAAARAHGTTDFWSHMDMNLIASIENSEADQTRPLGMYLLAHQGTASPDKKHRRKSHDDACREGFSFMNHREYIMSCIRNNFEKRPSIGYEFEGTVLSGRVSEYVVLWGFGFDKDSVYFEECHREGVCPYSGPREIILADSALA